MLPAPARLRRGTDIREVVRVGQRCATSTLVVHALPCAVTTSPQVGLLVNKSVGGSVIRHRVSRQLRHLCRDRISSWPQGSRVVIRALPAAAGSSAAVLGTDLDLALARVRWVRR